MCAHAKMPSYKPPNPATSDLLQQLGEAQEETKKHLEKARVNYKQYADKHQQQGPTHAVRQKLWLPTEHLFTGRPAHQLDFRFLGPFQILRQVNPVISELQPPRSLQVTQCFTYHF